MPTQPTSSRVAVLRRTPSTVVAFDTETTGLHTGARLVEIAAVKFIQGREVKRLVSLVNPGVPIPYQATAIHGITDRMVRGQPRAAEVLEPFLAFIEGATLTAHYASFDLRILADELRRARLPMIENACVCTCELARRHLRDLWDHKLRTVARHLKLLNGRQEHRALGDALLAAGIYHKLVGNKAATTGNGEKSDRKARTPGRSSADIAAARRYNALSQTPNQIAKGVFLCQCGYTLKYDSDHLKEDKRRSKEVPIVLPDRPRSKHSIFLWRGSVLHVSCHVREERD